MPPSQPPLSPWPPGPPKPPNPLDLVPEAIVSRYVNAAATVILVYDFLLTFNDEIQRIWTDRSWTVAKVLWVGHRYLNLVSLVVLPMIMDTGVFFISAILSLRCWALFGGNYRILVVLITVSACSLGLQIYPAAITFNRSVIYIPDVSGVVDRYTVCFLSRYDDWLDNTIRPWRIAGWAGIVLFDGVVTGLIIFRVIQLRGSGVRVTLAELMLREGIYYFATVSTLNVATMVTFAELSFAFQLLLQRITQVLTVVMVSRMFLNLKGSIRYGSKGAESRGVPLSSGMMHVEASEIAASLETQVTGPNHMSTLVGNLGNDLMHSSILDHWILDEKSTTALELQPRSRSEGEAGDQPSSSKQRCSEDSSVLPRTPTIKTTRTGLPPGV